jgi:hypothetical protein
MRAPVLSDKGEQTAKGSRVGEVRKGGRDVRKVSAVKEDDFTQVCYDLHTVTINIDDPPITKRPHSRHPPKMLAGNKPL